MSIVVDSRKGKSDLMTKDEQFFYDNAGYSYDPASETPEQGREHCARELARAEVYGREQEWEVEWRADSDADESFIESWEPTEQAEWNESEHCAEVAILRNSAGEILASCGGIWDVSREYRRVMEAELMSEALGDIEQEQQRAEECAKLMAS